MATKLHNTFFLRRKRRDLFPVILAGRIFGKNDMINQTEKFRKPGIMVLFKISHK